MLELSLDSYQSSSAPARELSPSKVAHLRKVVMVVTQRTTDLRTVKCGTLWPWKLAALFYQVSALLLVT